jgi:hypothetical protein
MLKRNGNSSLAKRCLLLQHHFAFFHLQTIPQLSPSLGQDHHPLFLFEVGGSAF